MGSCFYDSLHKYIDDPSYTSPASYTSTNPLAILQKVHEDERLDGLFDHRGSDNIGPLLEKREDVVLNHWNAWDLGNDEKALQERLHAAQRAAVALLVATKQEGRKYDFFLCHLLTSSHAIRILLPLAPTAFHAKLVRQWWLFVLLAYVGQLRPKIDAQIIDDFEPENEKESWKYVKHEALTGKYRTDAHWVKALRAMMAAEDTWGEDEGWWRKAACKLAAEFKGWGGFDEETEGYQPH